MQQETGEKGQMATLTRQTSYLYAYYVYTRIVFCSFLMYGAATIVCSLNEQMSCAQDPTNNSKVPTHVLILY